MDFWTWVLVALVVWAVFKGGMQFQRDELDRRAANKNEEEIDLGWLGPIAADIVLGVRTEKQAEADVGELSFISNTAAGRWKRMSLEEKHELGRNMIKLYNDPSFVASQSEKVDGLRAISPELFDEAVLEAKRRRT
ncbi:MAG: hypothetical protein GW808_15005 [Sphingomonadales bacterium]|nr:hypothetical protein [Sphingomonadales bacterium]NCO47540.1 hypothetical protein [Sphingomonadales bacterium]NCO98957.1 hypothetical protein [Sphingomonadales bacterium]NCP25842.1 hypothetical protein [Sphingomonadales bacterium]NCP44212.1 hypothetical protein [Sphingomonadales bacterium]